jgi:D-tyrosyl-tRNA(Tyr) deacylase
MRVVLQRVANAQVDVEGQTVGKITHGFLLLVGVGAGDNAQDAQFLARKIAKLRVFNDAAGKMNLDILAVGGAVLAVSQFTLYANTGGGNRPSFTDAASAEEGRRVYQIFCEALRDQGLHVETGVFQADMQVFLVNDGPVTIILESPKH